MDSLLSNFTFLTKTIFSQYLLSVMLGTSPLSFNFKVRTEESQEYSFQGFQYSKLEESLDSVCIIDDQLSYHIQCLHNAQVKSARSTNSSARSSNDTKQISLIPSMSLSYLQPILIRAQDLSSNIKRRLLSFRKCPNIARTDVHNRAFGAMFGVAIGDVIGAQIMNKKPTIQEIEKALLMEDGGVMGLRSGEGSDEWELNVALAEGLIEGKGVYSREIIAKKYLEWVQSSPSDMPVLIGIALSKLRQQKKSSRQFSKYKIGDQLMRNSQRNLKQESAIGLVRLIPLVIWGLNLQTEEFQWLIQEQMKLINPNPFTIEVTLLMAKLIRTLISTGDIEAALEQAVSNVWKSGNKRLIQLWNMTQELKQPVMHSGCASHIKFPFIFAIKQLSHLDTSAKDARQQYIQVLVRILSRGFNTDTNCSIVMGLIGAALGYDSIPHYFRDKILKSDKKPGENRPREYWSGRVVELVENLLKQAPIFLDEVVILA